MFNNNTIIGVRKTVVLEFKCILYCIRAHAQRVARYRLGYVTVL